MRITSLFNTMLRLPKSGIYGLVNHKSKMVYISQSKDICTSIARLVRDIQSRKCIYRSLIKESSKLEFIYLENINNYDSGIDISMKIDYFIREYQSKGYGLYNNKYKLQQLRVAIEVDTVDQLVYVKLVSKSYKKIVVGVFKKKYDAEEFAICFESMSVITPVYAINDLTRSYIKALENKC